MRRIKKPILESENAVSIDKDRNSYLYYIIELALIKAYKEPMHNILEDISEEEKSSAKTISSIREINGWINNSDKNIFNQALKKLEVDWFIKVRKANGVRRIKTWTIIYRKE